MKANETIIQPFLEGTKQYVVPLFQRGYCWKNDNWKNLWEDLLTLYDTEDNREHFFGAIVSMPIDMQPAGVSKYLLIDGQQRITTLFLILAAIRDLSKEIDQKLFEQINFSYLFNSWAQGTNVLKLLPSQLDQEQFSNIIYNKGSLDSNNGVVKAYEYFRKKLIGKDLQGLPINFEKMHSVLMRKLAIVSIVLDKEENPYSIFESLNATGVKLTQGDLVRNFILMRINDRDEQEISYRDYWLPMQEKLGDELSNFLWRYLNKDGTFTRFVRMDSIYDEVKQKLLKVGSREAIDLLMDIHTFSEYYNRMINPEYEDNQEIRTRLKRLNRWDVKTAYPFLLNIYHDYCTTKKLAAKDFLRILDIIESYVIRRFFCHVPTNLLNKIFIGLYQSLDKSNIIESLEQELIKRDWPSDSRFTKGWVDYSIYKSSIAKCRHILESLESVMMKNNEPVDIDYPKISIEHIMPQTLNESWEKTLGKEASSTYVKYLHTIGNLTLTGSNTPMGNKSFIGKREVFAKSNFALNKELADTLIWGEYMIVQRAKKLGQIAIKIWRHPGGDEQAIQASKKDDPTGSKPTGFSLFGTKYQVDTWRDMLLKSLSSLAEVHGEGFASKAVNVKTSKRKHIANKPEGMIMPMQIPGTNLFVEANQSSRSVLWVIHQTMQACGDAEDQFEAYW